MKVTERWKRRRIGKKGEERGQTQYLCFKGRRKGKRARSSELKAAIARTGSKGRKKRLNREGKRFTTGGTPGVERDEKRPSLEIRVTIGGTARGCRRRG